MLTDKPLLSVEELDAQFATALPQRDTMLVTIVVTNVLNNNVVEVEILRNANIEAAVQVCANVLANNPNLECDIQQ